MTRPPYYDWVATDTIYIGGARAFVPGSLIPNTTVAIYGYDTTGQAIPATDPPTAPDTGNTVVVTVGEVA